MLAASTAYVVLLMKFYIAQLPSIMEPVTAPSLVVQLTRYSVAMNWLSRLNVSSDLALTHCTRILILVMLFQYCLSDLIVVWRAWALWPGSRFVRWGLGSVMAVTAGVFDSSHTIDTPFSVLSL